MANRKKELHFEGIDRSISGQLFDPSKKKEKKEKYKIKIDEIESLPGIEPLNDKEKSEFLDVIMDITHNQHPFSDFDDIARRFGERIVPYILNSPIVLDQVAVFKLLNKLVTEKTAGEVLKAMRDHRIEIWSGALAVSRGKEKTASGLAKILKDWKFSENTLRSDHLELIKALGETMCDDVSYALYAFYDKLLNDKNYNKKAAEKLEEKGIDWLKEDKDEIMESLKKIGGPKAKEALEKILSKK